MTPRTFLAVLAVVVVTAAPLAYVFFGTAPPWTRQAPEPPAVPPLLWDALVPADWQPEAAIAALMAEYPVGELSDEDPRAAELKARIDAIMAEAPVVEALDGRSVSMRGYVVALGGQAGQMREFLLVPYYGACIHVPPPPPNQIVHVRLGEGMTYHGGTFDTVSVTGTLRVARSRSGVADAGYRLDAQQVAPYPNY